MKKKQSKWSIDHATSLDFLTSKINTEYFAILDSDATFLIKDRDEILIKKIDKKYPLIWTQAPGKKHKDFPLMFAILIKTDIFKELDISFLPKNIEILQDTWREMREKYLSKWMKWKTIKYKNTRKFKNGPFYEIIWCGEYYLNEIKYIFASHFGRWSTLGIHKYRSWIMRYFWYTPIRKRILRKKGEKEKKKWISICRNIIDKQI